ncbi:MAG: DUF452 family protein [Firmicutes bacterium]|nr:DUF452 family protein [Bacillota bacterium]MCM1401174.1 DUF452 family protein [Bacteroides sp.]MCM1477129.1 DUF452 family protein [Bacteroides sp.]
MKVVLTSETGSSRLLLLFAGWSMDCHPFARLKQADCDISVAYDYSDGIVSDFNFNRYKEIMVVAWSFGVIAAAHFISTHAALPITSRTAVNGTVHPVHESMGIPAAVFDGTLNGLSESSLKRFYRRMCGGAAAADRWLANKPVRTIESLGAELRAIAAMPEATVRWDKAWVAMNDRIIPPENQIRAWNMEGVTIRKSEWPHLPDFEAVLSETLIDKSLVKQRFTASASYYNANASVQVGIAERLSEAWKNAITPNQQVARMIEVGAGTGVFTNHYIKWIIPAQLELWDLTPLPDTLPGEHRICDAELELATLDSASVDAIASSCCVQWFSSITGFVEECSRVIKPEGWLVLSTFGPENFSQLGGNNYPTETAWKNMLKNDFEIHVLESSKQTLEFPSAHELLRHIKLTGVNAVSQGEGSVAKARKILAEGINKLTYQPIIIVARRK